MPDIQMCHGVNCPKRQSCYRATARPEANNQQYFEEIPLKSDGTCDFYMPEKLLKRG